MWILEEWHINGNDWTINRVGNSRKWELKMSLALHVKLRNFINEVS